MQPTENLNIEAFETLPTPEEVHARLPLTEVAARTVLEGRRALERILDRKDPRLFVVVGPCSIHDPVAGADYARRLKALADECRRQGMKLGFYYSQDQDWNMIIINLQIQFP